MFVAVIKNIHDAGEGSVYFDGKSWTDKIERAKIYQDIDDFSNEPESWATNRCKPVKLNVVDYPEQGKILSRVMQLADQVFGKDENVQLLSDDHSDPMIGFGSVCLYWNEHTSVLKDSLNGPVLAPGYQICVSSYDPGVRYHSDGSGTPPTVDYSDVGKPHENLDKAITEMFKLVVEEKLGNFFDWEADMEAQLNEDDYNDFWGLMFKE